KLEWAPRERAVRVSRRPSGTVSASAARAGRRCGPAVRAGLARRRERVSSNQRARSPSCAGKARAGGCPAGGAAQATPPAAVDATSNGTTQRRQAGAGEELWGRPDMARFPYCGHSGLASLSLAPACRAVRCLASLRAWVAVAGSPFRSGTLTQSDGRLTLDSAPRGTAGARSAAKPAGLLGGGGDRS